MCFYVRRHRYTLHVLVIVSGEVFTISPILGLLALFDGPHVDDLARRQSVQRF